MRRCRKRTEPFKKKGGGKGGRKEKKRKAGAS